MTRTIGPVRPIPDGKIRPWMRLRHTGRLLGDVLWMSRGNRMWWLLPLVAVVLLALAAAGATQTAVPYAVYTLF